MILCKVSGAVTASTMENGLEDLGFALLSREDGTTFVAADRLGAALGSQVLVCQGEAAQAVLGAKAPIDAVVIGVVLRGAPDTPPPGDSQTGAGKRF